jgi:transposase-like protein
MRRVRQKHPKYQAAQHAMALDDGTLTTPAALAMIQALIPLGLKAVEQALVAEVIALAGPRYQRGDAHPDVVRWGKQPGSIYLADQKLAITVPRVRDRAAAREVPLATYTALQTPRANDVGLFRRVLGGLSCREYEAAAEAVPEAFGLARSSVSRRFIRASARELRRLQERRLDDAKWLALVLDGKTFAQEQLVIALGVTETGEKRILGLVQTASENKRVIASFLRELGERGFPLERRLSYLAKADKMTWRRKLEAAWAHPTYADAKRALDRLCRELQLVNESAAASLAEGLEDTLTLHRLNVYLELGVSFKTTNLIESVMARLEARTRRVTHWRTSDQRLRWCASALWAIERQFRRVKNFKHLPLLKRALESKLPSTSAAA